MTRMAFNMHGIIAALHWHRTPTTGALIFLFLFLALSPIGVCCPIVEGAIKKKGVT